jgi:tetratricopeptide (TPR) repeat protein
VGLVVVVAVLPTWGAMEDDIEAIGTFEEMVSRSSDKSALLELDASCTDVDLSALMGDEERPELEMLLMELAVDPGDLTRHNRLGNYYARNSLWNKAAAAYRCALDLDESVAALWNNLGIVYLGQHNPSGAVGVLRRAVREDPDYALAFYNLGMAFDQLRSYDAALKYYEKAITLDPRLATVAHNPHVAGNKHQTALFLRRLRHNQVSLATSLDE